MVDPFSVAGGFLISRITQQFVNPIIKPLMDRWGGTINGFYKSCGLLPGKDASAKMNAITSQDRNQRDALSFELSRKKKQKEFEDAKKEILLNFAVWKVQNEIKFREWEVQQKRKDAIEQSKLDYQHKCMLADLQFSQVINQQFSANVFPLDIPFDHCALDLNWTATPTSVPFRIYLVETSDHNIFNTRFKASFAQYVSDSLRNYEGNNGYQARCTIQFGIWKTKDANGQEANFNQPAHIDALYQRLMGQPTLIINPICNGNRLYLDIIYWCLEQGKTQERLYDFPVRRFFHFRTSEPTKFNREYGAGVARAIAHIIDCHFLNEYGDAPLLPQIEGSVSKEIIDSYRAILNALTASDKFQDKIFSVYYGVAKAIKADQESSRKIVYDAVALWAYRKKSLSAAPNMENSEALEYQELDSLVECVEQIEKLATVDDLPFLKETEEVVAVLNQNDNDSMERLHRLLLRLKKEETEQEKVKEIRDQAEAPKRTARAESRENTPPSEPKEKTNTEELSEQVISTEAQVDKDSQGKPNDATEDCNNNSKNNDSTIEIRLTRDFWGNSETKEVYDLQNSEEDNSQLKENLVREEITRNFWNVG